MKKTWIQGDRLVIPNCNAAWHGNYHQLPTIFGQTTIASKSFDYTQLRTDLAHANAGRICMKEVQKRLKNTHAACAPKVDAKSNYASFDGRALHLNPSFINSNAQRSKFSLSQSHLASHILQSDIFVHRLISIYAKFWVLHNRASLHTSSSSMPDIYQRMLHKKRFVSHCAQTYYNGDTPLKDMGETSDDILPAYPNLDSSIYR